MCPGSGPHRRERDAHERADDQTQAEPTYDVHAVEDKWLPVWEELDPFRADDDSPREKRYALTMFPYPSGDLHMGHAEVIALHDVVARYWWQRGYEVLNPMGWDSFGLPAENAAIRNNEHPATYTYANIDTQIESFKKYGVSVRLVRDGSTPPTRSTTAGPSGCSCSSASAGWPTARSSPVNWCPQRPDRAGQRAGRRRPLRALRRRGDQARADPVVLQDHRLRPGAAGRPGRPGRRPGRTG